MIFSLVEFDYDFFGNKSTFMYIIYLCIFTGWILFNTDVYDLYLNLVKKRAEYRTKIF